MNESNNIDFYFRDFVREPKGVSDETITKIESEVEFKFPKSYLEVMKQFNGGEGNIGNNSWLLLFPLEILKEVNEDYETLMTDIPDYFLFGKDAADTGYAFHKSNKTIHSFGLMSDFKTDPIEFCGNSFAEFVEYLYSQ